MFAVYILGGAVMSNVTGFTNTQKIKQEAAMWLLKMDEQTPLSKKSVAELKAWVNTSDTHRKIIVRMSKTWHDMDVLAVMMAPPERKNNSVWELIKAFLLTPLFGLTYALGKSVKSTQVLFRSKLTTSATLLLTSAVCVWLIFVLPQSNDLGKLDNVYITKIGEHVKHELPDGSTLWLNSSSKVEVNYSENYRRIYLLSGEAFFKVKKDLDRPFEVYSEDRLIRALGTAFSVYRRNDRIEVLVSEGKVELAIVDNTLVITPDDHPDLEKSKSIQTSSFKTTQNAKKRPAVIAQRLGELNAGESISITTTQNVTIEVAQQEVMKIEASDIVRKLSWLDGKLVFAGESLEEVVTEISRHTSMRIDVTDPVLKKMRIGGHFKAGETDTLFYVLESGFGIQVNRLGENHVVLNAKK